MRGYGNRKAGLWGFDRRVYKFLLEEVDVVRIVSIRTQLYLTSRGKKIAEPLRVALIDKGLSHVTVPYNRE